MSAQVIRLKVIDFTNLHLLDASFELASHLSCSFPALHATSWLRKRRGWSFPSDADPGLAAIFSVGRCTSKASGRGATSGRCRVSRVAHLGAQLATSKHRLSVLLLFRHCAREAHPVASASCGPRIAVDAGIIVRWRSNSYSRDQIST